MTRRPLHRAGPFSATAASMLDACTRPRTRHLGITGETDVLADACETDDQITSTPPGGRIARIDFGNGTDLAPAFSTAGLHGTGNPDVEAHLPPPTLLIRGTWTGRRLTGLPACPRSPPRRARPQPCSAPISSPGSPAAAPSPSPTLT
ncbi:hypothetical protein [Thermomonospora catenispora]|uniref:hypothetical protein n=1 Tax=Thermomonospora catenispora TaxID=2493090 RepID=UPI00111CAB8D|nr:hypothetical protein [Thermomonospora catenispora]TNY37573.1 hypothetical protein EIO00_07125 [Thermomonospora catenispora]